MNFNNLNYKYKEMEATTSYYIYRLTLKSFLSEMSGQVSESVLEQIGDYILLKFRK